MKKLLALLLLFGIVGCGPSAEEIAAQEQEALEIAQAEEEVVFLEEEKRKSDIATLTCNVMGASRNMDGAFRIKEINYGREKIGEGLYLGSDETIKESFEWNLCKELVLNNPDYESKLSELKKLEQERQQKIYHQRLEQESIKKDEEDRKKKEEEDRLMAAGEFPMYKSRVYYSFSKNMATTMENNLLYAGIPAYIEINNTAVSEKLDSEQTKNWPKEEFYNVFAGPFLEKQNFEDMKDLIIEITGYQYPSLVKDLYDYKVEN